MIFIAYWFWKLYDRPSKRQVELAEERKEKHKEARMWRAVEEEMERASQIEAAAIIERKKAEARARAMPPAAGVMQNALAALDSPTNSSEYNEQFKPTTHDGKEIAILPASTEIADDSDLLSVENATEVRITDGYFSDELLGELFEEESESQVVESNEEAVPQAEQAEPAESTTEEVEETEMAEQAEIPQGEHPEQAAPTTKETGAPQQAEIPQGEQTEQSESTGDEQEMPVDVEWQEGQTSENDEWSVGW